jgi:hypothetical protein
MTITTMTSDGRPTGEPPAPIGAGLPIGAELLWRLAVRQFREHGRSQLSQEHGQSHGSGPERCVRCAQPWPCSGRRLAELGLRAAQRRSDRDAYGR